MPNPDLGRAMFVIQKDYQMDSQANNNLFGRLFSKEEENDDHVTSEHYSIHPSKLLANMVNGNPILVIYNFARYGYGRVT